MLLHMQLLNSLLLADVNQHKAEEAQWKRFTFGGRYNTDILYNMSRGEHLFSLGLGSM